MDFKVTRVVWTIFFFTVLSSVLASPECRECKPGLFSLRHCTETHDTVCSPCSIATFTDTFNTRSECTPCSKCGEGEYVARACSRHSDSICESCDSTSSENSRRECFQNNDPVVDEPGNVKIDENTEELEDGNTFRRKEGVYEGSGTAILEGIVGFRKADETVEGSGEIPDTANETVSVVILPDDGEGEDVFTNATVTVIKDVTTTPKPISSTPKVGDVSIGVGIKLENYSSQDVKTTQSTVQTTTAKRKTTPKTIVIGTDSGIVIDTDKTTRPSYDTPDANDEDDDGDVQDIDVVLTGEDDPQTGASRRQQSETSSGVAIGVLVAVVLIAAAVFFVFGFLVSRYWSRRRERSFNVLDAERRNGSTVTAGTIEYKEADKQLPKKTGVYDEIPADKQNGTGLGADKKPYTPSAADNVYSKPVTRRPPKNDNNEAATDTPDTGEKPADTTSNHTAGNFSEWAGHRFSINSSTGSLMMSVKQELNERPVSNIQYIDETDSDSETDKLLKSEPPSDNSNQSEDTAPKSPISPTTREVETNAEMSNDVSADADEQATESSPMIHKQSETKES